MKKTTTTAGVLLMLACGVQMTVAQDNAMSFFLTSAGPGNGAAEAHWALIGVLASLLVTLARDSG
jgi:hypothetical protein